MLRGGCTVIYLFFFLSVVSWAKQPASWNTLTAITEQHEFYKNFEPISSPKDSWQHLFTLQYIDADLRTLKDCVFYRVPGSESGTLKIKTLGKTGKCADHILKKGDTELPNIKLLQYAVFENKLNLDINYQDLKSEKWSASVQETYKRPEAKLHLSSAEFKTQKLIMLAPRSTAAGEKESPFIADGKLCHEVNDDCESKAPSRCGECKEGWYEVPNGCASGPKFCGRHDCGGKDRPACRRGMMWQKKQKTEFDCREDSSFAYCSKGLSVQCEGKQAFCR